MIYSKLENDVKMQKLELFQKGGYCRCGIIIKGFIFAYIRDNNLNNS